jgi:succinyl-diaminopimelate desuccinylase
MADALELTCELIRRRSLTPDDAGCQALIGERLEAAGFRIESLPAGNVSNLWATHGHGHPVMVLLGHTDVVPTGPLEQWKTDPFEPVIEDGMLYGRGAADMKSGLAVMVETAIEFVHAHPHHHGTLALLVTSDEEGEARNGTRHVVEVLNERGLRIDYCLVGEASSIEKAGDEVRIGRRGSLSGHVTMSGTQGHVAYPDQADNAAHRLLTALAELVATDWPEGDDHFPPLSLQVSNVASGTGAGNVIPGHAAARFNFRYPPPIEPGDLQTRVEEILARHAREHGISWHDSGRPFLSPEGRLRAAVIEAIEEELGTPPHLTTGGGTSDARFIAPTGAEIMELGPPRGSIHKIDEHVRLADIETLTRLYARIIESVMAQPGRLSGVLHRHPHLMLGGD